MLCDITKVQAESFILEVYSKSKFTANLYRKHLLSSFNRALKWELIKSNPFQGISLSLPKSFPAIISIDELHKILEQIDDKMISAIIKVGYYTGMRLGELVNMKWSWVDLNQKIITTKISESFITKSKRERIIPISNVVFETLYLIKNDNGYVFHREGERFRGEYISKQFKKAVRKAGLNDKIKFHSLRHSFCSNLIMKNVSIFVVKELAGHQSVLTTQLYSQINNGNLKSAIDLLD